MKLQETLGKIQEPSQQAMEACLERWHSINIPLDSLGKLQEAVVQMAGIYRAADFPSPKKALVIMCADNGVVEEGISQSGQEVTLIIAENFLQEKATAGIMCRETGTDIFPVDIGIASESHLIQRKVMWGTKNMAKEAAMTRRQAIQAIETGIRMAEELYEKGYRILATGEMGIGNTTTSSAITSVLLEKDPAMVTGRGAGLSSKDLDKKIRVIRQSIALHKPDKEDLIDVMAKVGGLDIAGMAGVFLGGAALGIPVVIDGFISGVAALCACRMAPKARPYMMASHISDEPASAMVLEALEAEGFLTCHMRLGEGTGALTLFPLLDMALAVYKGMGTFAENKMETYVPLT